MQIPIDWEKQYGLLEVQMRDMMKMSLKLMPESKILLEEIILENEKGHKYITVITNGCSGFYRFECFDRYEDILLSTDYSSRNTLEISKLEKIKRISVYIKDNINSNHYMVKNLYIH